MFDQFLTKSKFVVAVVLFVCASTAYGTLFFGVGYLESMTDSLIKEAEDAGSSQTNVQKITALMDQLTDTREHIDAYVLTDDDVVEFIEGIEKLTARSGVDGQVNTVMTVLYDGVDKSLWEGLSVTIASSGSWAETYKFLSLLEQIPYKSALIRSSIKFVEQKDSKAPKSTEWVSDFTLLVLKHK
ncbi:MAG: hypothetical protein A2664_01440 [Candidatus Taylorbacteria bacterium RIFCSPHIGHO2_01_FULL_46_22b]|uniref:Uncharacterized protein n=1 Tax=Candidatus Taylorbacteria bacterium RIFCSPHIGHO2_01_FULL_46_22b TaxID=1802301 RepID=A0A1G2M2E2_9BACT|nr:MAG: hypothetical protein A2664_01440 [Candidatus Taylorbacteria bacterium RIFCSPHIGHO2_01_FULL_46_22b]